MKFRSLLGGATLVLALALTACGAPSGEEPAAPENGGADSGTAQTIEVAADEAALAFEQTELTATAGQPINVEFSNPGALDHNWVLVEPGQEQAVADAAGADGAVAPDTAGVIATGSVLQSGGSETISVPAQEAGAYPYICTVPGHFAAGMVGTLTVE